MYTHTYRTLTVKQFQVGHKKRVQFPNSRILVNNCSTRELGFSKFINKFQILGLSNSTVKKKK